MTDIDRYKFLSSFVSIKLEFILLNGLIYKGQNLRFVIFFVYFHCLTFKRYILGNLGIFMFKKELHTCKCELTC